MDLKALQLEGVEIGFRNFEGREGVYNKSGDRSFAVFLDHKLAEDLAKDGWNVKFPKDQDLEDEDDTRRPHIQVSVGFEFYPANVFLISNDVPTKLTEDEVAMLDWAEIENVDIVLRPYTWSVNGNSGIKAYLKSGYFTIVSDKFASKYGL